MHEARSNPEVGEHASAVGLEVRGAARAEPAGFSQTALLPPVAAVRLVWARTGAFSDDPDSRQAAMMAEAALKSIRDRATQAPDPGELQYVDNAIAAIDATLRSLHVIHKGRELNFQENEKLRSAYLDDVNERLHFGNKASDFVKSLPSMTIASVGGVTLAQLAVQQLNLPGFSPEISIWAAGLAFAGAGYLLNLAVVRSMRKHTQLLYVARDYDRNLYYDQYVTRAGTTLTSLYLDLDRIHKNVFGRTYPVDAEARDIVGDLLQGVRPTFCQFIHKHMRERKITPELWALCETGRDEVVKGCPFWEG